MALRLGIGVVTFSRQAVLRHTLEHVFRHTKYAELSVAVADDGSTDSTQDFLRTLRNVTFVSGENRSIAWNKNRALFLLFEILRCDVVILLEDDCYPTSDGWEIDWLRAAIKWGHMNALLRFPPEALVSGSGTVEDPAHSTMVSAQCSAFSREAILFGGYFDPRFRGYGHEHVEHSARLARLGYGGGRQMVRGKNEVVFKLLRSDLRLAETVSHGTLEQVRRNEALIEPIFADAAYRVPWCDEDERAIFRAEMKNTFPRVL